MRILMAQNRPCIRNWKESKALAARGHEVYLASFIPEQLETLYGLDLSPYAGVIQLHNPEELLTVAGYFDAVHCHNEPDTFATVLSVSDTPSVHDCHDMMSIRGLGYNRIEEGIANKYSDGRIFVSAYQAQAAVDRYHIDESKTVVFNSSVLAEHLPKKKLPKIGKGIEPHFVYEGGLNMIQATHRYLVPIFKELCDAGAWVHVYGIWHQDSEAEYRKLIDSPRFVVHPKMAAGDLITEMTQYDMGLVVFNVTEANQHHLHSTLPNKLFEYLAAGIPVIGGNLHELVNFIKHHKCGLIWNGAAEMMELWKTSVEVFQEQKHDPHKWTVEAGIATVEKLYDLIAKASDKRPPLFGTPQRHEWEEIPGRYLMQWTPAEGSKMVKRGLIGTNPSDETLALEAVIANGAFEVL